MKRTENYIGTFENTNEGINLYKYFLNTMRNLNFNGRVSKKFRGNHRPKGAYNHNKLNATRFDVYLYSK